LLRLVDHPGDTLSRFHVANSPLGERLGLSDCFNDEEAAALSFRLRLELAREGYGPFVERFATLAADVTDGRDRRRLGQLAATAYVYDESRTARTVDFVEYAELQRVNDPAAAGVRVMTVHQAKGLEFDAVVLPHLDVKLVNPQPEIFLFHQEHPCLPPTRVVRNCSAAVRALDQRLEAMQSQYVQERAKEAISVLYVALTRPKHALYMFTGPRPAEPEPTYSSLLWEALGGDDSSAPYYEYGDPEWFAEARPIGNSEPVAKRRPSLQLAPSSTRRRRMPWKSPSADAHAGVDVADLLRADDRALERGRLFHRLFECIEWVDAPPEEEVFAQVALDAGAAREELPAVNAELRSLLGNPAVQAALSMPSVCEDIELFRERPFLIREHDSILSGVFDRLVLFRSGRNVRVAEVVEYKFDSLAGRAACEERFARYKPQLSAYRRAAMKLFGLPEESVTAKLLFVKAGEVFVL